jgi:hypothetical protein
MPEFDEEQNMAAHKIQVGFKNRADRKAAREKGTFLTRNGGVAPAPSREKGRKASQEIIGIRSGRIRNHEKGRKVRRQDRRGIVGYLT